MANEFVARKGIIAQSGGAQITGSLLVSGTLNATGYDIIARSFTGSFSGSIGVADSAATASYVLPSGLPTGVVSSSGQVDVRNTTGIATLATTGSNTFVGNQVISGSLTTTADTMNFNGAMAVSGSLVTTGSVTNTAGGFTGSFTGSFKGDGSALTGIATTLNTAGTSGTGTINLNSQTLTIAGANGVTTTASGQTVTVAIPTGTVSSSTQVDVRNTTGIATIATTGSNTFSGVQTISNTTNSTNFADGALIVQGGVGIAKNVNISGSLNVTGLLTVASMSTQYVTSSQYNIGVSRVILNDDDTLRFAGISVVDSGSTYGTGSLLWDSLNNRWIYEADDQAYNSAVIIAGPKNTGALGNEVGLTDHRVPVAHGDDHIDSRPESSSIRVDFPSRLTHVEAGLVVTGSVTSSVGFSGDGSNLTGIVTNLNVTGSTSGTGTIALKTQGLIVSGTNGIAATVSGQTVTLSGSNATTTAKGVASFNSTNFTVTGGEVTSNNITINGGTVTLGGTRNITLAQITTQGASTTDVVTLSGGATIGNAFQTSSTYTAVGPTTNEVVLNLATGSFDAAHFDYVLKSGANLRTGTVMAIWTAGSIEYTDTSTNDIGNTSNASFVVDTNSANVRLKFTTTSGTWTIKTATTLI